MERLPEIRCGKGGGESKMAGCDEGGSFRGKREEGLGKEREREKSMWRDRKMRSQVENKVRWNECRLKVECIEVRKE